MAICVNNGRTCTDNVNLSHLIGQTVVLSKSTTYYWETTRKKGGTLNAGKVPSKITKVVPNQNGYYQIYFEKVPSGPAPFFILWENIKPLETANLLPSFAGRNWFNISSNKITAFSDLNFLMDHVNKTTYQNQKKASSKPKATPTPGNPTPPPPPPPPADEETPTALKVSSASFGTLGIVLIGLYFLQKIRNKRK